jgi:GTP cyclohydrolase I
MTKVPGCGFDQTAVTNAVASIIKAVGENPMREGLRETPRRVAQMYAEAFSGINVDPREELRVGFEEGHREMVVLKDISFYSMCEHHFLPFFGVVHIGYIPNKEGRVVGVSKLARVVEIVSKRPQLQERMTTEIAAAIMDGISPDGLAVVVQAEHLCMMMRGVKKPGSCVITSAIRGIFSRQVASRAEFFSLIQAK